MNLGGHIRSVAGVVLRRFGVVLATFLWAGPALSQGAPIAFGFNESPPLAFTNQKGQAEGGLVRIAAELFKRAGVPATISGYPAARLFQGLQDGSLQSSLLVRVPTLQDCCLFSKVPVMVQEPRIYAIGSLGGLKSKEDLKGKSVITINGYSYAGMVKYINDPANNIRNEVAESFSAAFRMLEGGRADYLLAYEMNANDVLATRPINGLQSVVVGNFPVYLILAKSYPNAEKAMARFEEIIQTMDLAGLLKGDKP